MDRASWLDRQTWENKTWNYLNISQWLTYIIVAVYIWHCAPCMGPELSWKKNHLSAINSQKCCKWISVSAIILWSLYYAQKILHRGKQGCWTWMIFSGGQPLHLSSGWFNDTHEIFTNQTIRERYLTKSINYSLPIVWRAFFFVSQLYSDAGGYIN